MYIFKFSNLLFHLLANIFLYLKHKFNLHWLTIFKFSLVFFFISFYFRFFLMQNYCQNWGENRWGKTAQIAEFNWDFFNFICEQKRKKRKHIRFMLKHLSFDFDCSCSSQFVFISISHIFIWPSTFNYRALHTSN